MTQHNSIAENFLGISWNQTVSSLRRRVIAHSHLDERQAMTQPNPGPADSGDFGLPEPPYSPELLAELHADALPPDVAAHVRSRIVDDTAAQDTLAFLDRTQALLRSLPVVEREVPPSVQAATDRTLADIAADVTQQNQLSVRRGRLVSMVAAAASVLIIIAVGIGVWQLTRTDDAPPPALAQPTVDFDADEVATALTFVGRADESPFPDAAALRRCTAANGIPDSTVVVGSGTTRFRAQPSIIVVLATGITGRFDVLVVGPDCATGNPATIARTVIGVRASYR